ncbi:hypothetical protein MBENS4_4523 [Novosphingobium sp. MBES04]|nr:hypothetical protein MBENS4_4523 [Novosphingobium sp. MBES04]
MTSKATTWSDSTLISLQGSVPGINVAIDPDTGIPTLTFPDGYDPSDPSFYANPLDPENGDIARVLRIQYRPDEVETSEDMAKIDADFEVNSAFLRSIEVGAQYRRSGSLRYSGGVNASGTAIPDEDGHVVPTPYVSIDVLLGDEDSPFTPDTYGNWVGQQIVPQETWNSFLANSTATMPFTFFPTGNRTGLLDSWLYPTFDGLESLVDTSMFNHSRLREVNGVAQIPTQDITENIYAGYVKANLAFDLFGMPVHGNIGMRYVKTNDRAAGAQRTLDPNADVVDVVKLAEMRNSYTDWLPSANFSFELIPNQLIAFAGASKVLARPRPSYLAPNLRCNISEDIDGANTCSAGNPDLKPYRADQYDLSLSWYPNKDSLFSAALFYKDIKSYVINDVTSYGVDLFEDGVLYDVTRPENGTGTKITGIELTAQTAFTFLPAPLDGLGFQANYTWAKAKDTRLTNQLTGEALPYPYLSRHSYNLIGYYDKGPLNLRVAYNYRSKYLRDQADRSGNAVFNDATGYLDAKLTIRLRNLLNSSFFIEGKNLTKETERITAGDIRLTSLEYAGRRFYAGFTVRF